MIRIITAVVISVFIIGSQALFGSSMGKPVDISSKIPADKHLIDTDNPEASADDTTSAGGITVINPYPFKVNSSYPANVAVRRLDNGGFFTACEEKLSNGKFAGVAALYTENMQEKWMRVCYTDQKSDFFIKNNSVATFSDGNVIIAYVDGKDSRARFVIFNPEMKIIRDPVLIQASAAECISVTRLAGGMTAMIAFYAPFGTTGIGRFIIVNSSGDILGSPAAFSKDGFISGISAATLSNGLIFIAYNSGFGRSVVIDQNGNVIRPMSACYTKYSSRITAIPLDNGNVMVTFRDEQERPRFTIIDQQGGTADSPGYLFNGAADDVVPVKMNNGNVMAAFTPLANGYPAALCLTVINQTGLSVKKPKVIISDMRIASGNYQIAAVKNDMALILFSGFEEIRGGQGTYKYGFLLVK